MAGKREGAQEYDVAAPFEIDVPRVSDPCELCGRCLPDVVGPPVPALCDDCRRSDADATGSP